MVNTEFCVRFSFVAVVLLAACRAATPAAPVAAHDGVDGGTARVGEERRRSVSRSDGSARDVPGSLRRDQDVRQGAQIWGVGGLGGGDAPVREPALSVPRGDLSMRELTMTVPVRGAERVIAGLRRRFRSCYQRGLTEDPKQWGQAVFRVDVAPVGDVSSVVLVNNAPVSATVTRCVTKALMGASFEAHEGETSVLTVGMTFVLPDDPPDAGAAPSP